MHPLLSGCSRWVLLSKEPPLSLQTREAFFLLTLSFVEKVYVDEANVYHRGPLQN